MKPRITETDIRIVDDWLTEMAKDPATAFISHTGDETKIIIMMIRQLLDDQQKEIEKNKIQPGIDRLKVMSWLEGLTWEDWHEYHSDSEVSNIAKAALELLKEQEKDIEYLCEKYADLLDRMLEESGE